jgi:iron complex outermembrane receptor protein
MLLLVLVLVVPVPTASAQSSDPQQPQSELSQLSLEQLADLPIDSVFSASMYTQKVTEAPSSVTIITADEIRGFGHRTLADVLRTVRGFYVTYDRNYSYLGVRGFSRPGDYNARILLQVDGHRLNDNVFGSALIGTEFPLDVDSDRTHRDHPRAELGALWDQRVLCGHQRDHQTQQPRKRPRSVRHAGELRRL